MINHHRLQISPTTMWQVCLPLGLWLTFGSLSAGIALLVFAFWNFKFA